ncbi:MAG: putative metalloprotease CJM1_0395 family protein [Planctomycetota bacterium]
MNPLDGISTASTLAPPKALTVRPSSERAFTAGEQRQQRAGSPDKTVGVGSRAEPAAGSAVGSGADATPGVQRSADGDSAELSSASRGEVGPDGEPLTEADVQRVDELKARDAEVRTHEQAHIAAAGSLFRGGPYYDYTRGPDGKQYATGGRVNIDTSEGRTPEETLQRAQQIRRSALAPTEPSSTDRSVAAKAAQMESEARREIAEAASEQSEAEPSTTDTSEAGQPAANPAENAPINAGLAAPRGKSPTGSSAVVPGAEPRIASDAGRAVSAYGAADLRFGASLPGRALNVTA